MPIPAPKPAPSKDEVQRNADRLYVRRLIQSKRVLLNSLRRNGESERAKQLEAELVGLRAYDAQLSGYNGSAA